MRVSDCDTIIPLPPITVRQLNTIAGALQLALVRYPLLLQLRRWDETEIDPLDQDDLRELRDTITSLVAEVAGGPDERRRRWRLFGRTPSAAHRFKHRRGR
jgi:hypothetical protein